MILTSPKGKAEWPHLVDPDIEFNPDGLYHTKLVCKKSESLEVKKAIDDLIAQEVKKQHDQDPKKAIKKAPLPYNESDDEITFNFKLRASGKRKSDGKPFTQEPNIVNADLTPFDTNKKIWRCTLRIKTIQVLELVTSKASDTLGELKAETMVAPKVKDEEAHY